MLVRSASRVWRSAARGLWARSLTVPPPRGGRHTQSVDAAALADLAFSGDELSRMTDLVDEETIASFLKLSADSAAPANTAAAAAVPLAYPKGTTPTHSPPAGRAKKNAPSAIRHAKVAQKPTAAPPHHSPPLRTVLDVFRYAVTRFSQAGAPFHAARPSHRAAPASPPATALPLLAFGQSTTDATEEAHLLLLLFLSLPLTPTADFLRVYGRARLSQPEVDALLLFVERRCGRADACGQRASRTPVAYLLKGCFLQGERLYVDERALIPRSFIAELLSPASKYCLFDAPHGARPPASAGRRRSAASVRRVLDLCCGSGALAILAFRLLAARGGGAEGEGGEGLSIDCADICAGALEVCRRNIRDKGLELHIRTHLGDGFGALGAEAEAGARKYDLILCNPPYVDARAMSGLPEEYAQEPALALDGGPGGMSVILAVLRGAGGRVADTGCLILEVGAARVAVRALLASVYRTRGPEVRGVCTDTRRYKGGDRTSNPNPNPNLTDTRRYKGGDREGVEWLDTANSRGEVVLLSAEALREVAAYLHKM